MMIRPGPNALDPPGPVSTSAPAGAGGAGQSLPFGLALAESALGRLGFRSYGIDGEASDGMAGLTCELIQRLRRFLAVLCFGALLAACGVEPAAESSAESTPELGSALEATYYGGVESILNRRCGGCHVAGGAAPFALTELRDAQDYRLEIADAIEGGSMPPWMPDPDCREYVGERRLPEQEEALLLEWIRAGTPPGEPREAAAPVTANRLVGNVVARPPAPYTPNPRYPDDYRCFLLDHEFQEPTFVTGIDTIPGASALVHHVLHFVVPASAAATIAALDEAAEGPGYPCFGGPGVNQISQTLSGWVPGAVPNRLKDGDSVFIAAGSRVVTQIHYNTVAAPPEPDLTELHLLTSGTPTDYTLTPRPLANLLIEIRAMDPSSVHTEEFKNRSGGDWEVMGVGPHMHNLGRRIRVDAIQPDGSESCLVDIPAWDFDWQQFYEFLPGQESRVAPGGSLRLTCEYDNSQSNQPVVNGEQLESRDVSWGAGTLDEMCLAYAVTREPFDSRLLEGSAVCSGFDGCRMSCPEGDPTCLVGCAADAPGGCGQCALLAITSCGSQQCPGGIRDLGPCLQPCVLGGGDIRACLAEECPSQWAEFWGCFEEHLYSGACNGELDRCNISF